MVRARYCVVGILSWSILKRNKLASAAGMLLLPTIEQVGFILQVLLVALVCWRTLHSLLIAFPIRAVGPTIRDILPLLQVTARAILYLLVGVVVLASKLFKLHFSQLQNVFAFRLLWRVPCLALSPFRTVITVFWLFKFVGLKASKL